MSVHKKIKAATRIHHDQTEQLLAHSAFSSEFTVHDYRLFLLTNALFHRSLEQGLSAYLNDTLVEALQWPKRRKTPLLLEDLRTLGIAEEATASSPMEINQLPQALGVLYVAEGATLGGVMIRKALAQNAALRAQSFAFLECYGTQTGYYWKSFVDVLEQYLRTPDEEVVAIEAAQHTFQAYARYHQRAVQYLENDFVG